MIQDRAPGSFFVGRQREMETLVTAIEDALSSRSRMVIRAGEPGIGKTRTAHELASYAENRGAQVLWGWCYEKEGAPLLAVAPDDPNLCTANGLGKAAFRDGSRRGRHLRDRSRDTR